MTRYDAWRTNADYNYAGQRMFNTLEEDDMLTELRELEKREADLEYDLDVVREDICSLREKLGL